MEMLDSVRQQSYSHWQLCLADATPSKMVQELVEEYCSKWEESRIKYCHLEQNQGIAANTNAGIALAEGEWIGLLDHDDLLAPEALYEIVALLNRKPEVQVIYSDEDQDRKSVV